MPSFFVAGFSGSRVPVQIGLSKFVLDEGSIPIGNHQVSP